MSRRRLEYDAHDGSHYAEALNQLDAYAKSRADGEHDRAASAANRAWEATERLSDQTLVEANDAGTSGHELGRQLERTHGAINYRLKRARARASDQNEEDQAQTGLTD